MRQIFLIKFTRKKKRNASCYLCMEQHSRNLRYLLQPFVYIEDEKINKMKRRKKIGLNGRPCREHVCVSVAYGGVFFSFHIAAHKCSPSNIEISLSKIFPPKGICRWNRIEEKSGIETYDEMCCWVKAMLELRNVVSFFSYAP